MRHYCIILLLVLLVHCTVILFRLNFLSFKNFFFFKKKILPKFLYLVLISHLIASGLLVNTPLSNNTLSSIFTSVGSKKLGRGTWSTMIGPFQLAVFVYLWWQVFGGEDVSDSFHADIRGFVGFLRELRQTQEAMREVIHYTQSHGLLNVP